MRKLIKISIWIVILAGVVKALGLSPDKPEQKSNTNGVTTTSESVTTIESTTLETTTLEITTEEITTVAETTEKLSYDYLEMNSKIIDSFEESVSFNEQGEDGYEWTQYVYELELQESGAVHVTVEDTFIDLSEEDKTFVLNSVNNLVNMEIFLVTEETKSYYITANDRDGNKVAQSEMLDFLKYKFY